jgi:Ca-activated chloride channel family protein
LLALLLLPVAALAFRRGWLMVSAAIAVMYLPMPPVHASAWDDLWLRPDQQAARALADGDYSRAAEAATDPLLRGAAAYRQGDFQAALAAYRDSPGAEGAYNQGNALSMLGQYRAAIEAYDRALALEPTMEDARFNRGIVAGLLAQRDRPATDTERSQTQATTQTESSQPEAGQQSADADDASDSGESEDSSPSDESADGGQVAAQSETEQPDEDTGEQEEGQSAESSPSDSAGGDPSDEGSDTASMAGDERSGGDQSSSESAEGSGDGDATAPGSVADASAGQRGIDAGDQVTQGGEQDDTGDGLTADITADQPGQEDSASDREEPDARPSPDSAGEAGRMASADTERSGATDDDRALQESATVDRNEAGQGQPGGGQDNEVGRSFAEAAQRLAERQGEGPDGEGNLIEPDASTGAAGPAAQAPRGPGAGDDSLDGRSPAAASDWSEEERLAAEQWLRRIPDDPGGLLRRKFLYQYRERQQAVGGTPPARR